MALSAVSFFVEILQRLEIDYVFGVPGRAVMPLYNELYDRGYPRMILSAHETGAAFMALDWAHLQGKIGVCCGTTGPGALNLMTGVATAYTESIPLLVVTGQVPLQSFATRAYQESNPDRRGVDTIAAFRPITKRSGLATSGDHLVRMLSSWLSIAQQGRPGPVHISVPWTVWNKVLDLPEPDRWLAGATAPPARPVPSPEDLRKVACALQTAANPVMLVGRGVACSRAGLEALTCATAWNLPLVTTARGKGAVPSRPPRTLGHIGPGGAPETVQWLSEEPIDLLLAVGTSLGPMAIGSLATAMAPPQRTLSINIDPEERGALWPADHVLLGDAAVTLRSLTDLAEPCAARRPLPAPVRLPTAQDFPASQEDGLHPGAALATVRDALPEEAVILPDSGNHWLWSMRLLQPRFPNAILPGRSLGAMGQAIAGAIGAKLAWPDRPVIAITGDGSFLMHGAEVVAARNCGARVLWIVMNDHALGRIYSAQLRDFGGRVMATELPDVDFGTVAQGYGLWSRRITNLDDIEPAIKAGLTQEGPALIELIVSRSVMPPLEQC